MSANHRHASGRAFKLINSQARRLSNLVRRNLRRALCLWLITALLLTSTPAAAQTIVGMASEASTSLKFWFYQSGWNNTLKQTFAGQDKPSRKPQEKQKDRDARVARIEISPSDVTVQVDERVAFAAIAYDQDGNSVGGVKVKWSCQDEERNQASRISSRGDFIATIPGKFKITAETEGGQRAQVKVMVNEGARRRRNDKPSGTREVSTRDLPPVAALQPSKATVEQKSAHASLSRKAGKSSRAHAAKSKAPVAAAAASPAAMPLPGDGWDGTNYWSADDPGNNRGNPPGGAQDGGAGSGNFQITSPVLALNGRGLDIGLGLAYNSRLWNKAGSQITYDIDRDWPAPGWSLGFGKIVGLGVNNGSMIIDADGTRHGFSGTVTYGPNQNYTDFVGHTTDGSFIDYTHHTGIGGAMTYAQAKHPNGTVIEYGAQGTAAMYPTRITDANGNYITITYVNNQGPNIQTVTDTLGRVINFHYDAYNLLTAITAPGLGSGTRTLVRLHYRQLALSYSFSGVTPVVRNSNPWVIDAIYYPATSTGYWFGDTDSYSSYGMITKVVEQRAMSFSASSLNVQGTVTPGTMTHQEVYAFQYAGLTDAPTYTSMTATWTRDGVNTDQAVTSYEVHQNTSPRTSAITLPNGNKSVQYAYNAPGQFNDGLVYYDEMRDANNVLLQSNTATWEPGAYGSPRPTRVDTTDERGQVTAKAFSYGPVYNQVTETRNYGYGGQALLRATRTQYQNSSSYTSRHIFSLPTVIEVYASDYYTRVSRTEYQYDGQTLTDTPNVVMHDDAWNPYAPQEWVPEYCYCDYNEWGYCYQVCDPGYYISAYNPATDYRGNVTQVTTYANAETEPATGAIIETRRYDITGNMVTANTSCCQQTSISYTSATQYAYPMSKTRGSSDPNSPVHMTNSATYDFNTGLELTATDPNGRVAQTAYYPDTLRIQTASSPTGAYISYTYDEAGMSATKTTYLAGGTIADQNIKYLNGRGQVRREQSLGANSVWDIIDTVYDTLGRVTQQSLPYRTGETIQWNTTTYDALSRVISGQAPDGSTIQNFYNETGRPNVASSAPGQTLRVVDAWNREHWQRFDSDGRLVEVVEPNPNGNGTVTTGGYQTTYSYDTLGNLTNVTQDVQTRSFRYDSLGRLIRQKLAEASPTLDNDGHYSTSGGIWSDAFTYDERSNLTSRTDARGIKTIFNYNNDPLSRLQSIVFDTSNFGDTAYPVLAAPTITYSYVTTGDLMRLSSVTSAGVNTDSFTYDSEGRVATTTQTLASRPAYPMTTEYIYDSLDRTTDVRYPAEYGNGAAPRKVVHQDYDIASRLSAVKVDGANYASQIAYNASSQTTSLKVGASGANQITENYSYHAPTGLLENQTVVRGASTLLNLTYDYAGVNGKRTGQLTRITNNLDSSHRKDRNYEYDALGRLAKATGGLAASPIWTQQYTYDRFGNRLSVTASGNTAKLERPEEPKVQSPTAELAMKYGTPRPDEVFASHAAASDSSRNTRLSRSEVGVASAVPGLSLTPQGGTPVFTDDPLVAGTTSIKAVHITELRDAINQLRARATLAAATWTDASLAGSLIKAVHIAELRTALSAARTALGLSNPAYTDPTLTADSTTIKAAHIQELRDRVKTAWTSSSQVPRDGLASLSYNPASNRITTSNYEYNAAGSLVRSQSSSGGWQRFEYDAAGRLINVKTDNNVLIASYAYGASNQRLMTTEGSLKTYYAWAGDITVAEYNEGTAGVVFWSKSYIFLRSRLLATLQPNGSGGEVTQYHHPDNLGTRLITNASDTSVQEQVNLPFGTALNAESTGGSNRRFTSYDRSSTTGLDYAINRTYDSQQGRFTQVDPIGMSAASLDNPQTLNLYAYCGNDPINHTDANGLIWGWLKRLVKRIIKALIHAVVTAIIAFITTGNIYAALAAGVADFLKEIGWPSKGWLPGMGRTTPPFNPNAGSILSSGVSSLNRYIIYNLAQAPAQVACTFNINIFGASGQLLADIQKELSRIFESGGHKVVFGQPNQANGGTMNLNIVSEYTGAAADTITSQGISRVEPGILGVTPPTGNTGYVNQTNVWLATGRGFSRRGASQGTIIGRVGAHEVIQHGFLKTPQEGIPLGFPDVTYGRQGPRVLGSEYTRAFNINLSTAGALGKLCRP
jgi:RHS repeat-associated protein